jgi:hypothetical protein
MASSSDAVFGLGATQVIVPPGATNAVLVVNVPREIANTVKYLSGGSLEIHGTINGSTMAGASLAPLIGAGYLLGTTEAINIAGPARFYLMATGSTAVACLLKGLSAPGFNDSSLPNP